MATKTNGWVTKIYYLELLRASEGLLSFWSLVIMFVMLVMIDELQINNIITVFETYTIDDEYFRPVEIPRDNVRTKP
jgi:hypothetical protein